MAAGLARFQMLCAVAYLHALHDVVDQLPAFSRWDFHISERQLDVFPHSEFVDEIETLEHETDISFTYLSTLFLFKVSYLFAVEIILPVCRIIQQADDIQ